MSGRATTRRSSRHSRKIRSMSIVVQKYGGSSVADVTKLRQVADRVMRTRQAGHDVVVAGYQGVSYRREVTTLGRGGSDTSAVALAAALGAEYCEICSDVDGVYTADPRTVPGARRIGTLSYEETQELAESGAKVLNAQAVEFAKEKGIAIYARATASSLPGADPSTDGTVVRRYPPRPPGTVVGIASERNVLLLDAAVPPGEALELLDADQVAGKPMHQNGDGHL